MSTVSLRQWQALSLKLHTVCVLLHSMCATDLKRSCQSPVNVTAPVSAQTFKSSRCARDSAGEDGDEDAEAEAPYKRRKRKRLPGEDANLRFDEMEAYLQVCSREMHLPVARSVMSAHHHQFLLFRHHRPAGHRCWKQANVGLSCSPTLTCTVACFDNMADAACAGR